MGKNASQRKAAKKAIKQRMKWIRTPEELRKGSIPPLPDTKKDINKGAKKKATPTAKKVNSDEFLSSYEWRKVRYEALKLNDGRCELCGRGKPDGIVLNVDHIKPRKKYPKLALDVTNLQCLCGACNHGKGNWDETDWRNRPTKPELDLIKQAQEQENYWKDNL